ncbi:formyltransferase family protein [Streptomyces sp900105755]|uniref:formyltransferase family protein n=1 Tax=Streptomyces sp. 900105755 TaxID=3154389 RepID=UPI00331933B0
MKKNVIFVTGHEFGVRALEGIFASSPYLERKLEVSLAIGLDARHSEDTVGYQSVRSVADANGTRHVDTSDGTLSSMREVIESAAPDYLVVVGWSRLVDPSILRLPAGATQNRGHARGNFGSVGMHPTSLPLGRGQAPIPWTIIKGVQRTALTVFFLAPTADSGPVIAQYPLEVRRDETAASLFYRFKHLHFQAGMDLAHHLISPTVVAHPQDDSISTVWPKRRPRDGLLRHDMTRSELVRTVRALLGPYPRAYIERDGEVVPIRQAFVPPASRSESACDFPDTFPFECIDGTVLLEPESNQATRGT